jgi:hypothetical protein
MLQHGPRLCPAPVIFSTNSLWLWVTLLPEPRSGRFLAVTSATTSHQRRSKSDFTFTYTDPSAAASPQSREIGVGVGSR